MKDSLKLEKLLVPISIIVAGALVGAAVLYANKGNNVAGNQQQGQPQDQQQGQQPESKAYLNVAKITSQDHIYGNKKAKIKVVAYTDLECPYCSKFHPIIKNIVDESNGEIALVLRYFPLPFHPQAQEAAESAECVYAKGGDSAYWKFVDNTFAAYDKSEGAKIDLAAVASKSGANISSCDKASYDQKIKEQAANGQESGLQGTPFAVVVVNGEAKGTIDGAYPKERVQQIISDLSK